LKEEPITHSYPCCWRCKNPVIFRSTPQWFISMEANGLRKKALENIERVNWVPSWGRDRIYSMIENRPDWCVSRQRSWGIPLPLFYCESCEEVIFSQRILDNLVSIVEREGSDAWFMKEPLELMPEGTTCSCGGKNFRKKAISSTFGLTRESAMPPCYKPAIISNSLPTSILKEATNTGVVSQLSIDRGRQQGCCTF